MATKPPHKLRFAVIATDVALISVFDGKLHVFVVEVDRAPYPKGTIGLPGGLIHPEETAEEAATRHLREKGGYEDVYMEQLATFSGVKRDPRGRVVSVAYVGLLPAARVGEVRRAGTQWIPVSELPELAYDHNDIVRTAVMRLQGKIEYTNIVQHLLPREFTLTELQRTYEIILNRPLDKRNFRKKILGLELLKKTGRQRRGEANRPAELYTFRSKKQQVVEVL